MEDQNSPEAIAARTNQEDPIVMYLIVRESLGMGVGKTAAQCAHASQMLTLKYFELSDTAYQKFTQNHSLNHQEQEKLSIFQDWLRESFRKVVLKANDKEWEKVKAEFSNKFILVVDAGLTEIAPMSETVIGLWPMKKSQAPKVIKKLQALK